MSEPEFAFTRNANPVVEIGLGDTRVPTGTGVWDSARWDDPGAVWQGVEPAWLDTSCYAIEAEISRGRERATDRFVPGTAGIVLNNVDGWADMAGSPSEIAAVSLRPGRQIRIGVDVHSIGVVWLFRGVIDKVTPNYDPVQTDYVKLDCIDMLGEVGHVKLVDSAPVGGDDTVTQRMHRLLDACKHPTEKRIIATDTTKLVQTSYGEQAVDLLGQAADSAGGIVYGDEAGNIVYKPFGWQNYPANATPPGIGNVSEGVPGIPAFTPEPYLDITGTPVTTPDSPSITLPGGFTVFATVRHPVGLTGTSFLAGQWTTAGQREWDIERDRASGRWTLGTSIDGIGSARTPFTSVATPPTGLDETWAFSVLFANGFGGTSVRAYRRVGGDDLSPIWAPADDAQNVATLPWANRNNAVSIGSYGPTGERWPGRIYDVELVSGQQPTPKGAVVWRFDVSDTSAGSTAWTDPRGRVWTVGGSALGHVHPDPIPAVPAVPGDICPAGWEVSYDRMDLATAVELKRVLPEPVPRLRYTLDGATGPDPTAGTLRFDSTDQQAATFLRVHVTTADGTNAEPFLRNIVAGTEVKLTDVGDVTNNTRQYVTTTGAGPINGANGRYYIMGITWVDGLTGVGGVVDLVATFIDPPALVVDDDEGQVVYGTEVYSLTDLTSIDDTLFNALANRVLATRGYKAMPRLEAVTLDAKAARGDMATLEMMATCKPELPSRYACRLRVEDGRVIFDRNMFAVSTLHHIERNEWTLRIGLDDASWAAASVIYATEAPDIANIVGTVSNTITGVVATTESDDTSAIAGQYLNIITVLEENFESIADWITVAGTPVIQAGRTGNGVSLDQTDVIAYDLSAAPSDTVTIGFAWRVSDLTGARALIQLMSDGGTAVQGELRVTSAGLLTYYRGAGATLLGTSSATGIASGTTYYYIELQVMVSDTIGYVIARVNGTEVLNVAAIDTRFSTTSAIVDQVRLMRPLNATVVTGRFDDMYITTGAGAPFRGSITVP